MHPPRPSRSLQPGRPSPGERAVPSDEHAVSPVVGVALLAVLTAVAAGVLGAAAVGAGLDATSESPPRAAFGLSVDAGADRVGVVHRGGDALAVEALTVQIAVDGEPLAHQPPVPFFAARGFASGPTGPFNSATDGRWTAGEAAALRLAGTNEPEIAPGATVTVRLYAEGRRVATLSATA